MLPVTKTMISDAFLELSKSKPVDKITVKDIVETCSITRQTFYYHFQDITDVVEWSLQQRMEEISKKSFQAESMHDAVRVLVSTVVEYSSIINRLMSSQKRDQTERLLVSTIRDYIKGLIDKNDLFLNIRRSDMEMALRVYSHGVVGVLLEICHDRKNVDLDMISSQVYQLISGEMFKLKAD